MNVNLELFKEEVKEQNLKCLTNKMLRIGKELILDYSMASEILFFSLFNHYDNSWLKNWKNLLPIMKIGWEGLKGRMNIKLCKKKKKKKKKKIK